MFVSDLLPIAVFFSVNNYVSIFGFHLNDMQLTYLWELTTELYFSAPVPSFVKLYFGAPVPCIV